MKKILTIIAASFILWMALPSAFAQSIPTLDQFTSTTSPSLSITQRTWGKAIQITGLTTGDCLTLDGNSILTTTTCGSGGGGGIKWPFTKQADGSQATSTTIGLFNGFNSQASSTLTKFTFDIATGTSATTTNFATDKLCLTADTCRTTWPSAGSFAWPFTKLGTGEQATSTTLSFQNGFLSMASSTIDVTTFTGGNVGIGTSTPQQKVVIPNNTYFSGAGTTGNTLTLIGINGGNQIQIGSGASDILFSTAAHAYFGSLVSSGGSVPGVINALTFTADGERIAWGSNRALEGTASSANLLKVGESYTNTALYGNVGINTLSPNYKLEVNGTASTTNLFATSATTTNATTSSFAITNITSKLLKTQADGSVVGASAGTDYQAAGSYALQGTTITVAGTANQITSSVGAQDLSTNRTWTLSLPSTLRLAQASSTVLDSGYAYFGRTATSSFNGTGDLFVVSSTTLQNFTAQNSTTSQATTTNFSAGTICLSGDCKTAWPGGLSSITATYPAKVTTGATPVISLDFSTTTANSWSLLNQFNLASSSVLSAGVAFFGRTATSSFNGAGDLLIMGSTTHQNFTAINSTTTQATTTNLAVSSLSSNGFVKTYGGTGNFTIDTNTYLTSAVTAVTATYPILATTGNTPALSFAFGTTTANSWSLLNQFNLASTSVFSAGFASFGRTATTTINGTGDLFVVSSTTLQNFTATNATTSQATTTNFAVTQASTLSKIPYISPTGNFMALGIGTNLTLTNGTLSASGGAAGIATTTFATTTSQTANNALAYLLNDTDILSIGAKSTSTAKFWVDPNITAPTYVFQIASTTPGSGVGSSTLWGITPNGHIASTSTRPTLSSCGTSATIQGTDAFGIVTAGTSHNGTCLVTFNKAYANAPACQVSPAGYASGGMNWLSFVGTTTTARLSVMAVATGTVAVTVVPLWPSYRFVYDCKEVLP